MEDFADAGGDVYVLHSPINYDIFIYKNWFATTTELMRRVFSRAGLTEMISKTRPSKILNGEKMRWMKMILM